MAFDEEKFKTKLKKCKSLDDYRSLAKEYKIDNINKKNLSPEEREYKTKEIYRRIYQKYRTGHKI